MTELVVTADLERWFSSPRLSTYATAGVDAVELYQWNTRLGAAVFEIISHTEVLMRNAFDRQLSAYSGTVQWFDDPFYGFNTHARSQIAKAKTRATNASGRFTPEGVLTELSFGFWRFLVSSIYSTTVWPRVRRSFMGLLRQQRDRAMIESFVVKVGHTRNRIAHHETVFNLPTPALEDDIVLLASWIDPDAAGWIRSVSRVGDVLVSRPT